MLAEVKITKLHSAAFLTHSSEMLWIFYFFFLKACMIWELDCVCTHSCIYAFLPAVLLCLVRH